MALSVERDAEALGRERVEVAPALVFPLERCVLALEVAGHEHRLDRASFGLLPARVPYRLSARTDVAGVVTLRVGEGARRAASGEYAPHFVDATFAEIVAAPRVFPRTRWVDEIVQRYVFERVVCERHASAAARFLETEITKELFFLGKEQLAAQTRASAVEQEGDLIARARQWLEAHLFEPLHVGALARHCRTSESTLLRAFRRAVGVPPIAYVRRRRLEEALGLLESGRYTASEVAARVGYASQAAFSVAFRQQYGSAPSRVRPKADAARVLPPHGEPPVRRRRKSN